jgi:hypothetical protein
MFWRSDTVCVVCSPAPGAFRSAQAAISVFQARHIAVFKGEIHFVSISFFKFTRFAAPSRISHSGFRAQCPAIACLNQKAHHIAFFHL